MTNNATEAIKIVISLRVLIRIVDKNGAKVYNFSEKTNNLTVFSAHYVKFVIEY